MMSPHHYANLIAEISCSYYDMERIRIVRAAARRSAFTSYQILGLVASIRNEDHKLGIAKELYFNAVDKENYHFIRDAFSYRYSKRNFDLWLSSQLY